MVEFCNRHDFFFVWFIVLNFLVFYSMPLAVGPVELFNWLLENDCQTADQGSYIIIEEQAVNGWRRASFG